MKRQLLLLLTAVLAPIAAAEADDMERRHELAAQLLEAMQMEQQMASTTEALKASIGQMVPAGAEAAASTGFLDLILAEMSYENIRGEYVAIYAELFTAEELAGLLDFFRSPVGQSWVEKQSEVMMRTMQISQSKMADLMPRIMEEMTKDMPQGVELVPAVDAADEPE